VIDYSNKFLMFVCGKVSLIPSPIAQCITLLNSDGVPVAGAVYDNYNTVSVALHLWVDKPNREFMAAVVDYPFNKLGVKKVINCIMAHNTKSRRLAESFGARLEHIFVDTDPTGDICIYTTTKAQCTILNSPKWARVVSIFEEAS
jgi:RimJ/RimL family protein N-acetyltransferase